MNNKKEDSFIEIVKSKMKNGRIKKDQLVIFLLAGILLLVIAMPVENEDSGIWPWENDRTGNSSSWDQDSTINQSLNSEEDYLNTSYEETLSRKLEEFLEQVEGVGDVRVLMKVNGSSERIVEKDVPVTETQENESNTEGSVRSGKETIREETTVYEETKDGRQVPYVVKEYAPRIEGVLIAAQGGDQPIVAQHILESVQALLQIEVHKIRVLKMK